MSSSAGKAPESSNGSNGGPWQVLGLAVLVAGIIVLCYLCTWNTRR